MTGATSASLTDLIEQQASLERRIREARSLGRATALAEVKQLMADHGLTAADILPSTRTVPKHVRAAVAPKYRDPATGATWTGRGLKPRWLAAAIARGASVDDFRIASPADGARQQGHG